jgi:hypothetical protein
MKTNIACEIPDFRRLVDGLLRKVYRSLFTNAGGTAYWPHLSRVRLSGKNYSWTALPIGCSETSVYDYQHFFPCEASLLYFHRLIEIYGAPGGAVGSGTALQAGRLQVRFPMVSSEFFIDVIHYGPGFDSASNRNEYQEYILGGKGGRCIGLTTVPP